MTEIPPKHAKRIADLIKSKWAAIFLLIAGLVFGLLSPIAIAVGLLYGFECRRFLRKYPDMGTTQFDDLQSAKRTYFTMAFVHIGVWILVAVVAAIVMSADG